MKHRFLIERFDEVFKTFVVRDGADELLKWLHETDFYTAPASSRFHGAHTGGLVEHSLNVYNILVKRLNYTDESVAIVALLHDICKVDYYAARGDGLYYVDEDVPLGDHADKSIILIQRFIRLTNEEIMAIRAHMGGWDHSARGGSNVVGAIFNRCPLAVHLHIADMEASYLMEERKEQTMLS